jgi:hypothetical protein
MEPNNWTLTNLPPKGHIDAGHFAWQLFEIARLEKLRLGKNEDFLYNFALYKGRKSGTSPKEYTGPLLVNLYFANIERTISNITARVPTGEVVDLDGIGDDAETIISLQLKKWWKDTNQQKKTKASARMMEIYGVTIEKPVRNPNSNQPDILVTDPFAFFPAPGNWDNMGEEAPYVCFAYLNFKSLIEEEFEVTGVSIDDGYELLGLQREEMKLHHPHGSHRMGNYSSPMTMAATAGYRYSDKTTEQGLIIEVWVRDSSTHIVDTDKPVLDDNGSPLMDEETDEPVFTQVEQPVYPDGVRKITITRTNSSGAVNGWLVLDDSPNPNVNYQHLAFGDEVKSTYPWGRLPVYTSNSYRDGLSVWGFAASEQVGDLIRKIHLIISKLVAYTLNVMAPPLIVQQHCGITKEMISNELEKSGRLVLMPSTPNARIEFMTIPSLPATFFQVLNLIVGFFDRIYQIEDADRGVGPKGVVAASAIIALQERNQVLMQTKTSSVDYLAEQRSRWAIGLWQNWGTELDSVMLTGEMVKFRMADYVGRKFNFIVESGSTTPKTSLQLEAMAKWLYEAKAIGQKGLLETLNWPNYKEEIERTAESQLDQALQILIDSGLPAEQAIQLKEFLLTTNFQGSDKKPSVNKRPAEPKSNNPPSANTPSES